MRAWNGAAWVTAPNGSVVGNNKVLRRFVFGTPVTTDKIRVVVNSSADNLYSRVVEVEALSCNPVAVRCVNNLGEPGCHISIQGAIDGSPPNGQINVRPGSYFEDIVINKANLKLFGAGAGSTSIIGPIGGANATAQITAGNVDRLILNHVGARIAYDFEHVP